MVPVISVIPYPTPFTSPVQVPGLPPAKAVDGGNHSIALATDGSVWGWGRNNDFQTGKNQWTGGLNHPDPVRVDSLGPASAITAGSDYADFGTPTGGDHTLALQADGSIWGWGDRWYGQLGNNDPKVGGTWIPREAQNLKAGVFALDYVAFGDSITTGFSNVTCSGDPDARASYADGCGEPASGPATPYPARVAAAVQLPLTRVGIWGYTAREAAAAFAAGTNKYQVDKLGTEGDWEPQLRAVARASRLVTGALGINDMEFSDVKTWAQHCVSVFLQVDDERCRAYASERAREIRPFVTSVMKAIAVAEENGAQGIVTLYYNPFANLEECTLSYGIAEVVLDELNGMISQLATSLGLTVADLRTPFIGHGAGLEDLDEIWVVGTECNDLLAAWQGAAPDFLGGDKEAVAREFDPHPNDRGSLAIAESILSVASL